MPRNRRTAYTSNAAAAPGQEQADRTGRVMPEDAGWRDHFTPVAPVQLTRAWSPLPYGIELLGSPGWMSVEPDALGTLAAACVWRSPRPRRHPPPDDADQSRFHRLLVVAVNGAGDNGQGVLVAVKPGWSYDHAHSSAETARLMAAAGFVVQDRHA